MNLFVPITKNFVTTIRHLLSHKVIQIHVICLVIVLVFLTCKLIANEVDLCIALWIEYSK